MASSSFTTHRESMSFSNNQAQLPGPDTPTLYIPVAAPPTPSPSPRPGLVDHPLAHSFPQSAAPEPPSNLTPAAIRREYLAYILNQCTPSELLFISTTIAPLLKRDFLRALPTEISLHVLSFVDDPKTLARASQVSRRWRLLVQDESIWKKMCGAFDFERDDQAEPDASASSYGQPDIDNDHEEPLEEMERFADYPMDPALEWLTAKTRSARKERPVPAFAPSRTVLDRGFSYRFHFQSAFSTMMNWRHGGHLLRSHRVGVTSPDVRDFTAQAQASTIALPVAPTVPAADTAVITSVALDADWVVVGLANHRIHIFSARTGVLSRTLIGHELGVWAVNLVSRGGYWGGPPVRDDMDDLADGMGNTSMEEEGAPLDHLVPPSLRVALGLERSPTEGKEAPDPTPIPTAWPGKRSDVGYASEGWGQPGALVVSGGCDKVVRVWDVKTGYAIYILHGHTSTIRCLRMLHNRPIAITGSRDTTLRVWDVQRGRMLRVLQGHQQSVRCLDVCGNRVVSGSYDTTCRIWDVDTGECLHVLRGHSNQIYSVAFDAFRIASGGLDTSVRVWDAESGKCIAILSGHTALVCQLQLSPSILATGGSDGRVITFSLKTFAALHRIMAHDSSVTSLQFDKTFLVTAGNDGRVRLFETKTGVHVRDLSERCDSVWKVAYNQDTCAIMCRRHGKTVMEIWSFKPRKELRSA